MKSKNKSVSFEVTADDHGSSLLNFLKKKCPEISSAKSLKKAIESKGCLVNGKVEYFSTYKLMKGDVVELRSFSVLVSSSVSIEIVYEDKDLLIINKPPAVVSDASVITQLLSYKEGILSLLHRLDKDTSGLLMLAKNSKMLQSMKELFSKKEVQKYYLALIDGSITKKSGTIDNFIGKKGSYQGQTIYGTVSPEEGERSITNWRILEKGLRCSLILLEPKTGRTHQLRVHMKEIGHPILGDYQYAKQFNCPIMPSRQMLHAWGLHFFHPISKQLIEVASKLPEDFIVLADQLKISQAHFLDAEAFHDTVKKNSK